MIEFKRLTEGELKDFISRVVVQLEPTLTRQILSIVYELEGYRDKIENGTLIELPCKVGDSVYIIDELENSCSEIVSREVESCIVDGISIYSSEICLRLVDSYKSIRILSINKVYTTKEEAEEKLKELKRNENTLP